MADIILVAAVAHDGVIGAGGGMPWHVPADLRRFKAITLGRPVVMGRRTYESIGRPLPGRRNIVLTRDRVWRRDGVETVPSLAEALALTSDETEVMIIGGGQVYAQAMDLATRLEITHLDLAAEGDTRFPEIDPELWTVTAQENFGDGHRFVTYERAAETVGDAV